MDEQLTNELVLAIAKRRFHAAVVPGMNVTQWAGKALEAGHDSPSLRILAGLTTAEDDQVDQYLSAMSSELNVKLPDDDTCLKPIVGAIAQDACNGKTSLRNACREIYKIYADLGYPRDFYGVDVCDLADILDLADQGIFNLADAESDVLSRMGELVANTSSVQPHTGKVRIAFKVPNVIERTLLSIFIGRGAGTIRDLDVVVGLRRASNVSYVGETNVRLFPGQHRVHLQQRDSSYRSETLTIDVSPDETVTLVGGLQQQFVARSLVNVVRLIALASLVALISLILPREVVQPYALFIYLPLTFLAAWLWVRITVDVGNKYYLRKE